MADVGLSTASDLRILAAAAADGRIVVTIDADFHALLATSGAVLPSVIRLRAEGLRAPAVTNLVVQVLETAAAELEAGAVASCDGRRVRVRRLPL